MTKTRQQIFDEVCTHLMTQGERAQEPGGACCYRLPKSDRVLKCAAGALIKDDVFERYNETHNINSLPAVDHRVAMALFESGVSEADNNLVYALQDVHDNWTPYEWPIRLARVAGRNDLYIPPCLYEGIKQPIADV